MRALALLATCAALAAAGCASGSPPEATGAGEPEGWRALASSRLARTEVAAARVGRYVYVMGGFEQASGATTRATERYDIRRDRWTRVRDMPVGLNHAAAVAHRGRVFVVGGYRGAKSLDQESSALFRYDPRRDRWKRLPAAPTARGALAAGVIGHRLYAVGGAQLGRALTTLEIYDFRTRRWSTGAPMSLAREHLAGAVADGRFYALAGRASGEGNFTAAEAFDPRRSRWVQVPDMTKARGGIAAATVRGRIVVVGGEESAGTIAEVELYDPGTRKWRRLADLRTPRHGLGAVSAGGRVLVIEGGDEPGFAYTRALEALRVAP